MTTRKIDDKAWGLAALGLPVRLGGARRPLAQETPLAPRPGPESDHSLVAVIPRLPRGVDLVLTRPGVLGVVCWVPGEASPRVLGEVPAEQAAVLAYFDVLATGLGRELGLEDRLGTMQLVTTAHRIILSTWADGLRFGVICERATDADAVLRAMRGRL